MAQHIYKICLIFFCITTVSSVVAQRADYLIVENPNALLILNKYEQNSTADFPSFTPFRILEEYTLLSDAVTPALKVRGEGKPLFIVRDEKGKIIGEQAAGYTAVFRKCVPVGDTVRVLRDRSILIYEKYFVKNARRSQFLKKNDILIRLFKYKNVYYVKRINRSPTYGWCRFPKGNGWRKLERQAAGQPLLSEDLRLRIKAFMTRINLTYENYFNYFNKVYHNQIPVPRWEVRETDERMELRFSGLSTGQLRRSTEVLIRNLETLLLGSGYAVYPQENGVLQIRWRKRVQR
ncbi:MAG TPA: hypothetical protein ENK44_10845 [Caldithrix abyssi]|uniref:Uncharacterized protein n=1 Tax=Caldithrix abyssi TaxID=187145 RepID=A0A7V4WW42_CALAY|nr:hypothetical protein [Caldithrix abyssi]